MYKTIVVYFFVIKKLIALNIFTRDA